MALGRPISLTNNVSSKIIRVLATEGQTVFTVTGGYRINQVGVFRNGVRLSNNSDFTALDGATVTLVNAATVNDEVLFEVQDDFRVSDAIVSAASTQTIFGNLTVNGDLNFDGNSTGIVTSLTAGDNISLSGSTGAVTITGLAKTDVIISERILVSGVTTSTGGFVGNLTGNVTGNTSGTAGGLTGTPNITVGSVTASTASFSGNVTIGGTLIKEDVTNVDSVGLVTARSGVIVSGSGIGLSVTEGGARITGICSATDFDSTSDVKLKENINTVDNGLEIINQLRGVRFDWKDSQLSAYGVIAQELEQVLPELVSDADPKTVKYNGIIGILIEAVKELSDRVKALEDK